MKLTTILNKIIQHPIFDVVWFSLFLYLKYVYLFEEIKIENSLFLTNKAKVFTSITLILIALLFWFFKSRTRKVILITISGLVSVSILADIMYYRYFKDFTSFSLLFQMSQVGDIKGTVFQLIHGTDIIYLIDVIIVILLLISRKPLSQKKKPLTANKFILFTMIWSISIFMNLMFALNYSGDIERRNSNSISSAQIGAINFHIIDSYLFMKERIFTTEISDEKIKEIALTFDEQEEQTKIPYWNTMKGKNVLFVQMESFSHFVVNERIQGKEITPNFNRLIKESYYADNFYNQISDGHSSDAEFIALNSLYPLSKGSVSVLYGFNQYEALPKILANEGYTTFSAHAFRSEFWNRINTHKAYGFQESAFQKQYDIKETAGIGMKDSDFFIQSVAKLTELRKPFFSYFITLQNHHPFDARDTSFDVGQYKDTKLGNYLQSVHEADKAIGVLIKELKEAGLYENTVLVLYGDHDAELSNEEFEKWELPYKNEDMRYVYLRKVPFLIHFPNKEIVKIDNQILGQIDIMPTMLHLLGISTENINMYGRNLFDNELNPIVARMDNSYVTKDYVFKSAYADIDTQKVKAWNTKTGEEIEVTSEMIKEFEQVQNQITNSNLLIKNDAILELKKEGGKE